jgi:hypothetical protein
MIIENLNPQDTKDLNEFLTDMQRANPQLKWDIFPMGEKTHHVVHPEISQDMKDALLKIQGEIALLHNKIELIFGGHVLMHGRFVKFDPEKQLPRG